MTSTATLKLQAGDEAERPASDTFNAFVQVWESVLPASAELEHVVATAVPGCLTNGDLDICIRIAASDFEAADNVLARSF